MRRRPKAAAGLLAWSVAGLAWGATGAARAAADDPVDDTTGAEEFRPAAPGPRVAVFAIIRPARPGRPEAAAADGPDAGPDPGPPIGDRLNRLRLELAAAGLSAPDEAHPPDYALALISDGANDPLVVEVRRMRANGRTPRVRHMRLDTSAEGDALRADAIRAVEFLHAAILQDRAPPDVAASPGTPAPISARARVFAPAPEPAAEPDRAITGARPLARRSGVKVADAGAPAHPPEAAVERGRPPAPARAAPPGPAASREPGRPMIGGFGLTAFQGFRGFNTGFGAGGRFEVQLGGPWRLRVTSVGPAFARDQQLAAGTISLMQYVGGAGVSYAPESWRRLRPTLSVMGGVYWAAIRGRPIVGDPVSVEDVLPFASVGLGLRLLSWGQSSSSLHLQVDALFTGNPGRALVGDQEVARTGDPLLLVTLSMDSSVRLLLGLGR